MEQEKSRALHRTFQIPYVYNYITEVCRKQAEVIQAQNNVNVRNTGKTKPNIGNTKDLNWVAVRYSTVQVSKLQ
jgi:hypothetical protein